MPTACRDCQHLINLHRNPAAPDIWYSLLCRATPLPPEFDPFTGKLEQRSEPFAYCREVNRGECPKFEALVPDLAAQFR